MSLFGPGWLAWLFGATFAFIILLIFLRHALLALLAALAPLPGVFLGAWALGGFYPGAYAFGFCTALLMAASLLRRLLTQKGDWRPVAWAGLGAVATASQFYWQAAGRIPAGYLFGWELPLLLLLAGVSAGGLVLAGWRHLSFDEGFIARANRAAEARARVLEVAGQIAAPRWALALSGVALVMAALAWFEAPPGIAPDLSGAVVAAAVIFLLARDWRAAAAGALCTMLLWLFHLDTGLPFLALPALLLAALVRQQPEEGCDAWRQTLEEWAPALLFAVAGAVCLLVLMSSVPPWLAGFWGLIVAVTALIFFPALTAALWSLFPRHRSLEDMYRS